MRRPDWRDRLDLTVRDAVDAPFAWGINDCALFAARCVENMTGDDHAAELRGTYDSARGAVRRLREMGCDDLGGFVRERLGPPRTHADDAVVGDLVLVTTEDGPALAIALEAIAVTTGPHGLRMVPPTRWTASWEI